VLIEAKALFTKRSDVIAVMFKNRYYIISLLFTYVHQFDPIIILYINTGWRGFIFLLDISCFKMGGLNSSSMSHLLWGEGVSFLQFV
jgi:hypothetical protein